MERDGTITGSSSPAKIWRQSKQSDAQNVDVFDSDTSTRGDPASDIDTGANHSAVTVALALGMLRFCRFRWSGSLYFRRKSMPRLTCSADAAPSTAN